MLRTCHKEISDDHLKPLVYFDRTVVSFSCNCISNIELSGQMLFQLSTADVQSQRSVSATDY